MSVFIVENGATFAITTPGKVTIDGCAFQSGTTVTTDSENADSRIFNLQGRELKERPRAWNPHPKRQEASMLQLLHQRCREAPVRLSLWKVCPPTENLSTQPRRLQRNNNT